MLKYFLEYLLRSYIVAHQALPHRRTCVFYPTCSEYALTALDKYGVWCGGRLMFSRIIRCHPWQKEHYDPIPNN
jgi:hypothetical protein